MAPRLSLTSRVCSDTRWANERLDVSSFGWRYIRIPCLSINPPNEKQLARSCRTPHRHSGSNKKALPSYLSLSLSSLCISLLPSDSFLPASTLKLLTFLLPLSHPLSIFRLPLTEITIACLGPPALPPSAARREAVVVSCLCLSGCLSACLAFSLSFFVLIPALSPFRFLYIPTLTYMSLVFKSVSFSSMFRRSRRPA